MRSETSYADLVDQSGKKVADVVMEVTDDKSLEKAKRKHPEIEHAPHLCKRATLVKLTDKTCNLRDVATRPPADWQLKRGQEYFDWARGIFDALPVVNARMLKAFRVAFAARS